MGHVVLVPSKLGSPDCKITLARSEALSKGSFQAIRAALAISSSAAAPCNTGKSWIVLVRAMRLSKHSECICDSLSHWLSCHVVKSPVVDGVAFNTRPAMALRSSGR